jgi:hypothetical protein
MKPVCLSCSREYKVERVGVRVVEMLDDDRPYRLFHADLLRCPVCKHQIALASESAAGIPFDGKNIDAGEVARAASKFSLFFAKASRK